MTEYRVNENGNTVDLSISVLEGAIAPGETVTVSVSTRDDSACKCAVDF